MVYQLVFPLFRSSRPPHLENAYRQQEQKEEEIQARRRTSFTHCCFVDMVTVSSMAVNRDDKKRSQGGWMFH
jgi:hypothetical protein